MMQSITGTGDSRIAQTLDTLIGDTFHDRIQKAAMNQHRAEQTIFRATVLGYGAIGAFLMAYTLVFACIIRIWWITR
jgi:CHASE3 domain sensor protein